MIEGLDKLINNEHSVGYKGLLMNKLVKIWSGESYYIEDAGTEASVDFQHKRMHFPLKTRSWEVLRVLGQHESAHILFTNTNSYKRLLNDLLKRYESDKVWRIVNALEDRRIEYLFSKIYAGAEAEFRDINTEALEKLLGRIYLLEPLDRIIVQITAFMVNGKGPENKELQVLAEEIKEEIESKWVQQSVVSASEKVLNYMDKYLAKKEKESSDEPSEDEAFGTDKFLGDSDKGDGEPDIRKRGDGEPDIRKSKDSDKLEGEKDKHKSKDLSDTSEEDEPEPDEKPEKEDNEGDLKTEEDLIGKKEKIEESKFRSDARSKKSIEKLIKKRKSMVMDSSEVEKKDPFMKFESSSYIPVRKIVTKEELERQYTELDRDFYNNIKNNNIGLIQRLRTRLMEIKNAVEIQESKGGLINISRSINMVAQSCRPAFDRAVGNTNRNVSITFLLDQSGSMFGSKINEAKTALIILSEVLNGLQGFEFAVFGFWSKNSYRNHKHYHTMWTTRYKGFSTKRTDLIASARVGSGNRDGYHIRVVKDYIQEHAAVNAAKFLVVLSDGSPQDDGTEYMYKVALDDTMKAIKEVEYQFPVIGVLFGEPKPEQEHLYKNRVYCASGRLSEGLQELVISIQRQIVQR